MALMYTGTRETAVPEDEVIRNSYESKGILNDDSDDVMSESVVGAAALGVVSSLLGYAGYSLLAKRAEKKKQAERRKARAAREDFLKGTAKSLELAERVKNGADGVAPLSALVYVDCPVDIAKAAYDKLANDPKEIANTKKAFDAGLAHVRRNFDRYSSEEKVYYTKLKNYGKNPMVLYREPLSNIDDEIDAIFYYPKDGCFHVMSLFDEDGNVVANDKAIPFDKAYNDKLLDRETLKDYDDAMKYVKHPQDATNESVAEELTAYGYDDSDDFVDMDDDYYVDDTDDFYEDDVDGVIVSEGGRGALAVGIAAATTAAIGAISVAYSKAHRGGALSRKAMGVANGKSWNAANKEVENILKSNKTFKVSESALAFSKKYEASARGDVMKVIKMVEAFAEKNPITIEKAMQNMGSISDENAERYISGRNEAENLINKINGISKRVKVKRPKAQSDYREISSRELISIFNKVRDVVDSASDLFYKKTDTDKVSEYSETDFIYGSTVRTPISHGSTVRTPNRLFTTYARTVTRLYEVAHSTILAYVSNSLYALRRSSNSFTDKKSISENSTAEEKYLFAKALIEDARSQAEFETLIDEAAEEMCLDEGYVKNQIKKTTIFHGKAMKAAKDLSKEAKNAAKRGDYKLAAEKQQLYVNSLKDLYEECCEIEDDTKMIAVVTAVIKGLSAGLGANMIASTSFVGIPAAIKAGVNRDSMFNVAIPGAAEEAKAKSAGISMEELRVRNRKAYDKIAAKNKLGANISKSIEDYGSTARGKVGMAAAAVVGLVTAIINGKRTYNKQILKYASQERDTTLEFPKSRVDAKNKMRRMIRLAENILKDYENIAAVESK